MLVGCGRHAGGQGYNSGGSFCGGWAGNCGEGGSGGSSWYLICDRCRSKYLREKGGAGAVAAAAAAAYPTSKPAAASPSGDKNKLKYSNNKKNNRLTSASSKSSGSADKYRGSQQRQSSRVTASIPDSSASSAFLPATFTSTVLSPGDVAISSEPHHLMKQNAMFLLELAPSHGSALPLTCNTPSPSNIVGAVGGGGSGKMTPVTKMGAGASTFHAGSTSADFDAMLLPAVQESSSPATSSTGSSVLTPSPLSALASIPAAGLREKNRSELVSGGLLSPDTRYSDISASTTSLINVVAHVSFGTKFHYKCAKK